MFPRCTCSQNFILQENIRPMSCVRPMSCNSRRHTLLVAIYDTSQSWLHCPDLLWSSLDVTHITCIRNFISKREKKQRPHPGTQTWVQMGSWRKCTPVGRLTRLETSPPAAPVTCDGPGPSLRGLLGGLHLTATWLGCDAPELGVLACLSQQGMLGT